jgi:hypothetical protein
VTFPGETNVFGFPRFRWFTDRVAGLVRWAIVSVRERPQ